MRSGGIVNNYGGLLESWKVRLIVSRARKWRFPKHTWQDVQQEIIGDIMAFRFDPAKANGAGESTLLIAIIDNHLKSMLRREARRQRHVEEYGRLHGARDGTRAGEPAFGQDENAPAVFLDVQQAVAHLPERAQAVCAALSRGNSVSEIARTLGCGRTTARRIIINIRERFHILGLDGEHAASDGHVSHTQPPGL